MPPLTSSDPFHRSALDEQANAFVSGLKERLSELKLRRKGEKVTRSVFEGNEVYPGFLRDFFTCLKSKGIGGWIGNTRPTLDIQATLPMEALIDAMMGAGIGTLDALSKVFWEINGGDRQKGFLPESYRVLSPYFDGTSDRDQQSEETGRFLLLFSEAASLIHALKSQVLKEGHLLLENLETPLRPFLEKGDSLAWSVHDGLEKVMEKLTERFDRQELDFPEAQSFMQRVQKLRKQHLAKLVMTSDRRWAVEGSTIQELQLQLEVSRAWSELEDRGEMNDLLTHRNFLKQLERFRSNLEHKLDVMANFSGRVDACLEQRTLISPDMEMVLERILETLERCSQLKKTLPEELLQSMASESLQMSRLRIRLKNQLMIQERSLSDVMPEALNERYEYLQSELVQVFMRASDREIQAMERCLPQLFKVMSTDLSKEDAMDSSLLKQHFQHLLTSTGKILKKPDTP